MFVRAARSGGREEVLTWLLVPLLVMVYGVYGEPEDPVLLEEDLPDMMISFRCLKNPRCLFRLLC